MEDRIMTVGGFLMILSSMILSNLILVLAMPG